MINPNPKRSEEPVWWGLFGAGGTWFAMFTPITILVVGILVPMGIINLDAMSYQRMVDVVSSLIGGLFVIATLALPMWHAMHRLHHGMHDLQIHAGTLGKVLCYSTAYVITVLAIVFVLMV